MHGFATSYYLVSDTRRKPIILHRDGRYLGTAMVKAHTLLTQIQKRLVLGTLLLNRGWVKTSSSSFLQFLQIGRKDYKLSLVGFERLGIPFMHEHTPPDWLSKPLRRLVLRRLTMEVWSSEVQIDRADALFEARFLCVEVWEMVS